MTTLAMRLRLRPWSQCAQRAHPLCVRAECALPSVRSPIPIPTCSRPSCSPPKTRSVSARCRKSGTDGCDCSCRTLDCRRGCRRRHWHLTTHRALCPACCCWGMHANRFDVYLLVESAVPVVEESRKRSGGAWTETAPAAVRVRVGALWRARSGPCVQQLMLRSDLQCGFVCACCVQRLVAAGSSVPTNEVGDERVVKTGADGQPDQKQGDEAEAEEEEEEQQQEDEVREQQQQQRAHSHTNRSEDRACIAWRFCLLPTQNEPAALFPCVCFCALTLQDSDDMDGGDYVGNYGDDDEDGGDAFGDDGGACASVWWGIEEAKGREGKGREGMPLPSNNQCSALNAVRSCCRFVICSCCSDEGETF